MVFLLGNIHQYLTTLKINHGVEITVKKPIKSLTDFLVKESTDVSEIIPSIQSTLSEMETSSVARKTPLTEIIGIGPSLEEKFKTQLKIS